MGLSTSTTMHMTTLSILETAAADNRLSTHSIMVQFQSIMIQLLIS